MQDMQPCIEKHENHSIPGLLSSDDSFCEFIFMTHQVKSQKFSQTLMQLKKFIHFEELIPTKALSAILRSIL